MRDYHADSDSPRSAWNGDASSRREGGYQPRRDSSYSSRRDGASRPPREGGFAHRSDNPFDERAPRRFNPSFRSEGAPRENRFGKQRFERLPRPQGAEGEPREGAPRPYGSRDGGYAPRGARFGGYNGRDNAGAGQRYGSDRRFSAGDRPDRPARAPRFDRGERPEGFTPRAGYGHQGQRPDRPAYGDRPQRFNKPYDPSAKYSAKKRIAYREQNIDPNAPVRLNKFLANGGVCSRRDADKYIAAGVVTVNGQVVTELGAKVLRTDTVLFHDTPVKMEKKLYVLLNKPKGYVTTVDDPQGRKTVLDLIQDVGPERLYPVGRLDRNTTGVLLLTNDGELTTQLTHPRFLKKKVYHVTTDRAVTAADLQAMTEGIQLEDGEIRADAAEYASDTDRKQVGIEIHSGRNRIVRRIFEHLGYRVEKLDRVLFAGLTKKNVKRGDWRYLTETEVNMLRMGAYE